MWEYFLTFAAEIYIYKTQDEREFNRIVYP